MEIRHVRMDLWVPIGVKNEPNAQDEYDGYIGKQIELLTSHAPYPDLVEHLYWAAHEKMGFDAAKRSDILNTVEALRRLNSDRGILVEV